MMNIGQGLLLIGLTLLSVSALPEPIVLQEGKNYNGTQDVHIISWDGSQNQLVRKADGSNGGNGRQSDSYSEKPQNTGGWDFLEEGDYHTYPPLTEDSKCILIRFDLSGIKSMTSAKIGLYFRFERNDGGGDNLATALSSLTKPFFWFDNKDVKKKQHTLYVNRILKKWAAGTGGARSHGVDGSGAADNSGEVTWNSTGYELWQAMGAEGPEDIAPPESTTVFNPANEEWIWFDVTQSAKVWISDPSENYGVKIGQEVYPKDPATFLPPDITLPNGKKVYSKEPVAKPTNFAPGTYNFVSSHNSSLQEFRPKMVIEGERSLPVKMN